MSLDADRKHTRGSAPARSVEDDAEHLAALSATFADTGTTGPAHHEEADGAAYAFSENGG